jgi:acid phosphatase (class A)
MVISSFNARLKEALMMTLFSSSVYSLAAQRNLPEKPLPPAPGEYADLLRLSAAPQPSHAGLDSIVFPIDKMSKGFYRALKLRAVYIDVPVDKFSVPDVGSNSSPRTRAELDYLLKLQDQRTAELVNAAQQIAGVSFNPFIHPSDSNYKYYRRNLFHIGHSMGKWFSESNFPKTADLIANVWQDQLYYMWSLKFRFNRERPNALDPNIRNLENTMWPAYPSGHATFAYTNAFLLEELFPQYKDVIHKDAYDCAHSREILGVHFPSDSEAGRILARQIINEMFKSEKFIKDFLPAQAEVRAYFNKQR